jgi:adenylyltransferase/sulfurtransferase
MTKHAPDADLQRYVRQTVYPRLGNDGQRRLLRASALVAGCGALGGTIATLLVRAGVGRVRLVDPDIVERHNLQRQLLFTERHAEQRTPKVAAAAEGLRRANAEVRVEPIVERIDAANVERLCEGIDVIVDGLDNFPTRLILNDAAVKLGIPWVTGGALGADGQTMTILPGETPCLRCLMPECPPAESVPTCVTAGILGPTASTIASLEAIEAIKILAGRREDVSRWLTIVALWDARLRQVNLTGLREKADCPCCRHRRFDFLDRAASPPAPS